MFGRDKHGVDAQAAHDLATHEGYVIVDVRTAAERRQGHPPGSMHIVLDSLPHKLDEIRHTKVLAFCRSGNRSHTATNFLRAQGIEALNVKGGIIAWQRAGLPLRRG